MKTKEQIDEWVRKQNWFDKFIKNLLSCKMPLNYEEYLTKHCDKYFIWCAFMWTRTPEGFNFWSKIHNEYKEWFGSKCPKDLLKTGMIVEHKNGKRKLVLVDNINKMIGDECWSNLTKWSEDLKAPVHPENDINIIYEGYTDISRTCNYQLNYILDNPGKVIWRRELEIKELTLQEVADKFNIDVKQLRIKDNE